MKQKLLVAALALTLVLCIAMGVTLAWLTAETDTIVNTFVIGNIGLTLTETGATEQNGVLGQTYNIAPGAEIDKDPMLTVAANSEACYVFFKVVEGNNIFDGDQKIVDYDEAAGWTALDGEAGVFYREVATSAEAQEFGLFAGDIVTVNSDLDTEDIPVVEGQIQSPTLTITGYAIQKTAVDAVEGDAAAKVAAAWGLLNPTP